MIKVKSHGPLTRTTRRADGKVTVGRKVTFIEFGRGTTNSSLEASNQSLDSAVGGTASKAFEGARIHTQTIPLADMPKYPIGVELPRFINRRMFSLPTMAQQEDQTVDPQNVDNRPTYFQTYIWNTPLEDEDHRLSNEAVAKIDPTLFTRMRSRKAEVSLVSEDELTAEQRQVLGLPAQAAAAVANTEVVGEVEHVNIHNA